MIGRPDVKFEVVVDVLATHEELGEGVCDQSVLVPETKGRVNEVEGASAGGPWPVRYPPVPE